MKISNAKAQKLVNARWSPGRLPAMQRWLLFDNYADAQRGMPETVLEFGFYNGESLIVLVGIPPMEQLALWEG